MELTGSERHQLFLLYGTNEHYRDIVKLFEGLAPDFRIKLINDEIERLRKK